MTVIARPTSQRSPCRMKGRLWIISVEALFIIRVSWLEGLLSAMSTLLHVEQLILSHAHRNIYHRLYPMMHDRVSAWLENLGLGIYREAFQQNAITWDVLPELKESDLEALGVLLGHRKTLLRAIAQLSPAR